MKYSYCALSALLIMTPLASAKVLTAAYEPWPPFINDNEAQPGIAIEIVAAAYKTQGYDVQFIRMPWRRALKSVDKHRIDIIPALWYTEKRAEQFSFSQSYLNNDVVFIKQKNDPFDYSGIASLNGKKVGVLAAYGYPDAFLQAKNFERVIGYSLLANLKNLRAQRLDLTLADKIVAQHTIQTAGLPAQQFEFSHPPLSTTPLYLAISQTHPEAQQYLDVFNQGLAEIKRNGDIIKIQHRYGIR